MPYTDYSNFDQRYFEGRKVADPHPAGYSHYRRGLLPFDHYAGYLRGRLVNTGITPTREKILIVGCAYGYTVEQLIDEWGVECYGMDISQWAVNQADSAIDYGDRIYQGDVRSSQDLSDVQKATPGGRFRVIITECVLECLTDSEAQTAAENVRSEAQAGVYHRIWTADGSDVNPDWYNDKSLAEWQQLCDPNSRDRWYHENEFQPDLNR